MSKSVGIVNREAAEGDRALRSFAKALSWRIMSTAFTAAVAWAVTGKASVVLAVGTGDFLVKLVAYYVHERAWAHVGTSRPPASVTAAAGGE